MQKIYVFDLFCRIYKTCFQTEVDRRHNYVVLVFSSRFAMLSSDGFRTRGDPHKLLLWRVVTQVLPLVSCEMNSSTYEAGPPLWTQVPVMIGTAKRNPAHTCCQRLSRQQTNKYTAHMKWKNCEIEDAFSALLCYPPLGIVCHFYFLFVVPWVASYG